MKVLIPIGCRSDEGLSKPVITRLRDRGVNVRTIRLIPYNFSYSYIRTVGVLMVEVKPDLALIFGDRIEMCGAAAACYHNHIPIAHVYAGITNNLATLDDINRHVITLWSDIQFCESDNAARTVFNLFESIGKNTNMHVVGITHLDDVEISEQLVPSEPYDLILYNPITYGSDLRNRMYLEVRTIIGDLGIRKSVGVSPNPDEGSNYVESLLIGHTDWYYHSIPREQFLGLLKNCKRFITNSSAAIYEAPHFLKPEQIVHIGERNHYREKGPFMTGASDRIVEILLRYEQRGLEKQMGKASNKT